jgi:uncharacterized protein YjbJ (UPF0337 family)
MTQYPSDTGGESTTTEQVKEQVTQQADAARDKARGAAQQARGRFRDQVDQRSTQAGERLAGTADDVRSVAEELRRQGKDTPARLVEQAAGQADRAANYLRQASGDRILRDVEDFARSRPWAVAAGGLALGFAASRFLKASSSRRYRETGTGYRQEAPVGYADKTQVVYPEETQAGYATGVPVVGTYDPAGPDVPPRAE